MKLGIYGDSYAGGDLDHSWSRILSNFLACESYINYGQGATSVYFSYKKFLESAHKQDINIFIVTEPFRYPKSVSLDKSTNLYPITGISNIEYLDNLLKDTMTLEGKFLLENVKGWFIASDDDFMRDSCHALIDKIENLHPRTIFYPAFTDSFSDEKFANMGLDKTNSLYSWYLRQLNLLGLTTSDTNFMTETCFQSLS